MRLFRFTLVFSAFVLSIAAQGIQPRSGPLTDERIIALVHAGVRPDELARVIAMAPQVSFDLTPAATDAMMKAGVSEDTIRAMAAREQGMPPDVPAQPHPISSHAGPSAPAANDSSSETIPRFTIFAGGSYAR